MTRSPPSLLDAARAYTARGWRVVPIPAGQKGPRLKGWSSLRLGPDDLARHFNGHGNIGLLLGEPSGGLVDVDLDCDEARELAPRYLPDTPARSGRPGAPASHWWYVCSGAATTKHADPVTREMIVELRATGAQTLVGPSVHPSGEPYDVLDADPTRVDGAALAASVAALAEAVVVARHGAPPAPAQRGPTSRASPDEAILRRAAAYLDAMPPAISGQGGHGATYAAATALVHGFGLAPDDALRVLSERYNPRCEPPWSERELRHKVEDAASKPHKHPFGWLRNSSRDAGPSVDLSAFDPPQSDAADESPESPSNPGALPPDMLRVPGFVSQVMAYNKDTAPRWQPTLALAGALCLQAVLAARKVRDERGNRTNLYAVCLAGSGSGKENARRVNAKTLYLAGVPELDGQGDLASDAGLVTAVEAQPGVLFQIDEFGRWLRTIGDPRRAPHLFNVISTLMKLYSSASSVFKGKAYADAKRNKVIDQPCVSILATTAPDHFKESLTAEAMSDGFMARLLVFETEDMPPREWKPELDPPEPLVAAARWWGEFVPGGTSPPSTPSH